MPTAAARVVGGERPVTLHLPSPKPAGAMPLVILLHGFTGNGPELEAYMGVGREAAHRGIAFLTPDGTTDRNGDRFWNASDACCDLDHSGVDDAAYLSSLIEEVRSIADIDSRRIYIVGHSNGGFMAYRMACDHADLVAAVVSLAGVMPGRSGDCRPSEPVSILQIHGTADDVIRFDGGDLTGIIGTDGTAPHYPGALDTAAAWATFDGCADALVRSPEAVDVDGTLVAASSKAEATVDDATGCDPGGAVQLWTIPDGGHVPDLATTFAGSVVDFLEAHPKP